ncbi:MAG: aminotransferase, partial [Aquificaceae bacterium]|nr:aminotransferase [Aquificaceae bacterium]
MKRGVVLQARVGSSRFPGKVLSTLYDKSCLEWVLQKAGKMEVEEKILTTSVLEEDTPVARMGVQEGWQVIRGSHQDVLSRYAQAVREYALDWLVRITADCPLLDPQLAQTALKRAMEEDADYLALSGVIDGFDVEVIKAEWILKADQKAKLPSEREHVSPYIRKSKRAKKVFLKLHEEDLSHIHLSLDYPEDLVVIERVIKALGGREDFTYWDVVKLIKENPEVIKREKEIIPNEGYFKSLEEDKEFIRGLKGKPIKLKESLKHFEKTKKLIPNCSQTFSKSYLQFSVGASPLF